MHLAAWDKRTQEHAFIFNPAYLGSMLFEFVSSYEKSAKKTTPYVLPFCALPLVLYPDSRRMLPTSIRTGLYSWLERTPEVLVGYADRSRLLVPYIKEALIYATHRHVLEFKQGKIACGSRKAAFSASRLDLVTPDIRDTIRSTRMTGKWFAAAGEEQTILASLGVRP